MGVNDSHDRIVSGCVCVNDSHDRIVSGCVCVCE